MASAPPLWPRELPTFRAIDPPARLRIPLAGRADIRPDPKPPGTRVARGESLVRTVPESSHNPLAPIAGTIGQQISIILTSGRKTTAVEFEIDAADVTPSAPPAGQAAVPATLVAGIDRLRRAGVWADRHASPDLIGQLNQVILRPIETVICTVLDADAGLRLGGTLAATQAKDVVEGVELTGRLTGARQIGIAIEESAPANWADPIREAALEAKISIIELPNDYPQPDPTLMLYTIASRRLRPGNLPTILGVLLIDAPAAVAIARGLRQEPLASVSLAIHDHIQTRTHFLTVTIGSSLADVLAAVGISGDRIILRGGDLLRDLRLTPDSIIAGGELTIHVTPPESDNNPDACIRCGWCLDTCPTRVQPAVILEAAQRHDPLLAARAGVAACIDCGLCSHVCPSNLPLLESIRYFRSMASS